METICKQHLYVRHSLTSNTSLSGSYLGKNFCGFLGSVSVGPGMSIASIGSQGFYPSMVLEKLKLVKKMRYKLQGYSSQKCRVVFVRNREGVSLY